METDELNALVGVQKQGKEPYKLNEVTMSGDTGEFFLKDILKGKDDNGKYTITSLGKTLDVVFIKLRWKLNKYEEVGGFKTFSSSTEYDDKHTDTVTIYPTKESGLAVAMKEKYMMKTVRIIYCYVPTLKQVVRLTVKSSALTGDENKDGAFGLFEYQSDLTHKKQHVYTVTTRLNSVVRNEGDRRKEYRAMVFSMSNVLSTEQFEKIRALIYEVNERIGTKKTEPVKQETQEPEVVKGYDYPEEEFSPDDITFE